MTRGWDVVRGLVIRRSGVGGKRSVTRVWRQNYESCVGKKCGDLGGRHRKCIANYARKEGIHGGVKKGEGRGFCDLPRHLRPGMAMRMSTGLVMRIGMVIRMDRRGHGGSGINAAGFHR